MNNIYIYILIADKLICGYKRFLDVIIIFIKKGLVEENVLTEILNSLDSKLTSKREKSGSEVNFLDVKLTVKNNSITTDIFYKDTDSKRYLDFYSCHPRHIKRALPYNLARRICTIVSDND